MIKKICLGLALMLLSACAYGVDPNDAQRILSQEGVTDVTLTGSQAFFTGCSEHDTLNTHFTGTRNGQKVQGVVCGHWSPFGSAAAKAMTVRYY